MVLLKICLAQIDIAWEKQEINLEKADKFAREAAGLGGDAIIFPEMFTTGFSMNIGQLAEPPNGPTTRHLSDLARECGINLIAGFAVREEGAEKSLNIAASFDREGKLLSQFAKMHPFSLGGEDHHVQAGTKETSFSLDGLPATVFICYDLRFPEVFRRIAGKVKLIFIIANWPASRQDHWETLLKARAIENQAFVVGVNRVGVDGNRILYSGGSLVFGPLGDQIIKGGTIEDMIVCDIDTDTVDITRRELPFLKDM